MAAEVRSIMEARHKAMVFVIFFILESSFAALGDI